jgi:hypothetical protein
MVLVSARLRGIPHLDVRHFEYYQGGECLSNAPWLGPWRQNFSVTPKSLENHRKNQKVGLLYDLLCGHTVTYLSANFEEISR